MGFNNRSMGDMDEWGRPKKEASIHLPTMVTIPAGSFVMGTSEEDIKRLQLKESDWAYDWSDNNLFAAEQPQHQVSVKAFEIGQYPITNQEYNDFLFDTGHRLPKHWIGFTYPDETGLHPVVGVSKLDAEAYIQWLSKRTNSSFRLPTEAEWEYGARSADGRIYPWGNTFDPWRCNTSESGKKGTTQVGSYSPGGDSPFGLADMSAMSGNGPLPAFCRTPSNCPPRPKSTAKPSVMCCAAEPGITRANWRAAPPARATPRRIFPFRSGSASRARNKKFCSPARKTLGRCVFTAARMG
jgi:hypothetical protein